MSETENARPADIQDELSRVKGTPKSNANGSKQARTPFKDIGNNASNVKSTPKIKVATPSKFDAIRSLDDDENWRDRTEVVTKFEHTAYKLFAREILEDAIEKMPTGSDGSHQSQPRPEFSKMAFRETNLKSMDDSVLEGDVSMNLPHLDTTLTVPMANSTFVNIGQSNPATPNGSNTALECSLLSSFEKMKIKGIKEQDEDDDDDDDIFHDASDDFDSFSMSPSKAEGEKKKREAAVELSTDPLDMLMSSLEKITVSDTNESNLSTKSVVSCSEEKSPPPPCESPANEATEENGLQMKEIPVKNGEEQISADTSGNFKDPEFNPFLIGTTTNKSTKTEGASENAECSIASKSDKTHDESKTVTQNPTEAIVYGKENEPSISKDDMQSSPTEVVKLEADTTSKGTLDSQKLDTKRLEPEVPGESAGVGKDEMTQEIPKPKSYDLAKLDDPNFDPFTPHSNIINSPDVDSALKDIVANFVDAKVLNTKELEPEVSGENAGVGKDEMKSEVPKPKSYDLAKLEDPNFDPFAPHSIISNSPNLVDSQIECKALDNKSEVDKVKPSEENEVILPKKNYNLEKVLKGIDDPNFNPFESKINVVNSPDLVCAAGESKFEKQLNDVNALMPKDLDAQKKRYSIEVAPHLLKDPLFDPFVSRELVVNSPDLVVDSQTSKNIPKEIRCETAEGGESSEKTAQFKEITSEEKRENSNPVGKLCSPTEKSQNNKKEGIVVEDGNNVVNEVKVSPKRKYEEAFLDDKEDFDGEILATEVDVDAREDLEKGTAENKDSLKCTEEEEILPPKKGYNLDFLEALDDPSYDPFATKSAVVNSPSKDSNSVKESTGLNKETSEVPSKDKECATQKKAVVAAKKKTSKILPKKCEKKPTEEISVVERSQHSDSASVCSVKENQTKQEPQEEEEISVPKKGYQLDFLDNLDDPNFNPFATKAAVMNSPERSANDAKSVVEVKQNKTTKQNEKSKEQEAAENVPQESHTTNTSKQKIPKKNVRVPIKKKVPKITKPQSEENEGKSTEKEEEEIPVPKKAYQLDFLDKVDDPNFNPFATKAAVSNSPKKEESPSADAKIVSSSTVVEDKDKDALEVEEKSQDLEEKSCEEPQKANENKMKNKSKGAIVSKQNKNPLKEDKKSAVEQKKENDAPVPGKNYQMDVLENLDDPNFNPFASKAYVMNSPEKSSNAPSQRETEIEIGSEPKTSPVKSMEESSSEKIKENSKSTTPKEKPAPNSKACHPPTKESSSSSNDSDMFDLIAKEAMKLVAEVTPSKKKCTDKKTLKVTTQALQRDVFSPQLAQSGRNQDSSGAYNFEEFVNATDFFSNPGDLDVLGEYGKDGDKLNLVRNSLYVKFDPLVSGRQSLAPYLAQQKLLSKEENDPRRGSALMCFSPSPDKTCRGENSKSSESPSRPLLKTKADDTVMDTTSNMTINETTVCEGHNATVVNAGSATTFNTTIVSEGGLHDTVLHEMPPPEEKMIPESVMVKKIKEIEQKMQLVMQDNLLRHSCILEENQKLMQKQAEESEVVIAGMDEENKTLRSTLQQLQCMLAKVVEQQKMKNEEHARELVLMENKYDLQCKALKQEIMQHQQESMQHQEDLKKMEAPFYDLVKKYTRLQEVTETLRQNEVILKNEKDVLSAKLAKKEESIAAVLKTLEEKYEKAQQEFEEERKNNEQEKTKLFLIIKKAEVKILSLTDTVEKKSAEIERLTSLIDDITKKFG